ncbi:hypothetical protein DENSPDRAFT_840231 [Dentipellis sp. KUC8613]|nr:hypothetical protein DENSPDRAFT_840231 [Dentipellis sp. KUC8613]
MLGAHLVSKYTGSYTQFVQDRITDPLNMTSSTYSPGTAMRSGKLTRSWTSLSLVSKIWCTTSCASLCNLSVQS